MGTSSIANEYMVPKHAVVETVWIRDLLTEMELQYHYCVFCEKLAIYHESNTTLHGNFSRTAYSLYKDMFFHLSYCCDTV